MSQLAQDICGYVWLGSFCAGCLIFLLAYCIESLMEDYYKARGKK